MRINALFCWRHFVDVPNYAVMGLKDILGAGKVLPMDKLVEVVSNGIGRIFKSTFDRKDIDTKGYEIVKLAEARAKEMKIMAAAHKESSQLTGGIEYKGDAVSISSPKEQGVEVVHPVLPNSPLEERIQERLNYQEAKKQHNIESVTSFAAKELKDEPPVTNEPLDEDWTNRFFKIVEDVSNVEMQALWGKILAGEIKRPKSYSLRTLEIVRNLTKDDADTFMKYTNFAFRLNDINFLIKDVETDLIEQYKSDVYFDEIIKLMEIGLIQPVETVSLTFFPQPEPRKLVFISGNKVLVVYIQSNASGLVIPIFKFSDAGNALLALVTPQIPFDYLKAVAKSIIRGTVNVSVKHGDIISIVGDTIEFSEPLKDFD